MKICFMRHGESESNREGRLTGTLNSPLTDEGLIQSENISLKITSDFAEIFASDYIRCKQTVEILNKKLNIPINYDSRLRQRNFGSLGGKTWNEIGEDIKEIDRNQEYDYRPHGGEHVEDVKERVFSCIKDIKNKHGEKKVLVITSGGIIRLLYKIKTGKIYDYIPNSSLHEFEF